MLEVNKKIPVHSSLKFNTSGVNAALWNFPSLEFTINLQVNWESEENKISNTCTFYFHIPVF